LAIERADSERFNALEKGCNKLIRQEFCDKQCNTSFIAALAQAALCWDVTAAFAFAHPSIIQIAHMTCEMAPWLMPGKSSCQRFRI